VDSRVAPGRGRGSGVRHRVRVGHDREIEPAAADRHVTRHAGSDSGATGFAPGASAGSPDSGAEAAANAGRSPEDLARSSVADRGLERELVVHGRDPESPASVVHSPPSGVVHSSGGGGSTSSGGGAGVVHGGN